ncbi:MAG: Maf family protein [Cyanobacteria bacterium P01_H01_bin.15]
MKGTTRPAIFVLASASPARRKLLQMVGINPTVCKSDFDESQVELSVASELVETLALAKAQVVEKYYGQALILGCDSVLEFEGEIHGKPASPAEAIARLKSMRGRIGKLYTGHALIDQPQDMTVVQHAITEVYFTWMENAVIEEYVATGEPLNCAGSFALEGKGGVFVEKIVGCHSNVIGLSLPLLRSMLLTLNYDVSAFW